VRLKSGKTHGWEAPAVLKVLKGVMGGMLSVRRSFRVYREKL